MSTPGSQDLIHGKKKQDQLHAAPSSRSQRPAFLCQRLLKSLITVYRFPIKENKLPFSVSVCGKQTEVCR
jgi:hypothetical protein